MPRVRAKTTLLGLVVLLAGCRDTDLEITAPEQKQSPANRDARPAYAILDGAHGGNPNFFFLPPTVSQFTVPNGALDHSVHPVVEVCEWNGSACALPLTARFTRTSEDPKWRVGLAVERYFASWETSLSNLDLNKTYRLRVLLSGVELGHIDLDVVGTLQESFGVDRSKYAPVLNGSVFHIKFHVNKGVYLRVTSAASTITALGGAVTLEVPNDAVTELHVSVLPAQGAPAAPHPTLVPGTAFDFGPDGTLFAKPVRMTIRFDPTRIPVGVNPADLKLVKWVNGDWVPVPGSTVNLTHNTVSGEVNGFSGYGAGGGPAVARISASVTCSVGVQAGAYASHTHVTTRDHEVVDTKPNDHSVNVPCGLSKSSSATAGSGGGSGSATASASGTANVSGQGVSGSGQATASASGSAAVTDSIITSRNGEGGSSGFTHQNVSITALANVTLDLTIQLGVTCNDIQSNVRETGFGQALILINSLVVPARVECIDPTKAHTETFQLTTGQSLRFSVLSNAGAFARAVGQGCNCDGEGVLPGSRTGTAGVSWSYTVSVR